MTNPTSNLDLAHEYLRSVNAPFGLNQQLVVKGFARWLDERRSSVETPAPQKVKGCVYCDGGDAPCVGHGGLKVPGHFWTCICGYVNDPAIRFNRCGRCAAFRQSQVKTAADETNGEWVPIGLAYPEQNVPTLMRRTGSPRIPSYEVWRAMKTTRITT